MPNDDKDDTKAIARQAVEEEFRKKQKKRGYDSSDDEAGKKPQGKKQKQQPNKADKNPSTKRPKAVWEINYRDRAKERREGKKPIDNAEDTILLSHQASDGVQSLLHDVLENDEHEETQGEAPLVRGLDRTLIEKDQPVKEEPDSRFVANREQALEWLSTVDESALQSSLGRSLLPVFKQIYLPVKPVTEPSRAGLAIQRSTFLFNTNPQRTLAWQVPVQEEDATINGGIAKVSPVNDTALLERMQRVLGRQRLAETQARVAQPKAPPPVVDSDEDIFAVDDNDDKDDGKQTEQSTKNEDLPSKEAASKPRKTLYFKEPTPETPAQEEVAAAPVVARLQGLSQVDRGDEDVDFDGRLEEEAEAESKKKKKRRRKKKDGDDSD